MVDEWNVLGVLSATLGFISAISATWMFASACRFARRISRTPHSSLHETMFVVYIVKWMSCCDIILGIINGTQYLSVASSVFDTINSNYPSWACVSKAFVLQFTQLGSVAWNFILAVILLRIICFDTNLRLIASQMKYYHLFVWLIAYIFCAIPLIFNAFGYVNNKNGSEFECWIKKQDFRICLYGPVGVVLLFVIVLLLYCVYLVCVAKQRMTVLTVRIIYFTVAFVVVWVFPFLDRFYDIIHRHDSKPIIFAYLHDIGLSSFGLFNAIIWSTSDLWTKHRFLLENEFDCEDDDPENAIDRVDSR